MRLEGKVFAVDFDGTCVTHQFPEVGTDIGAQGVLRRIVDEGGKLILWTMRSDQYLQEAVEWFEKNHLPLYGVQSNPTQVEWTKSPKAYAHCYIDDAALGCPLAIPEDTDKRPYVDWEKVEMLIFPVYGEGEVESE